MILASIHCAHPDSRTIVLWILSQCILLNVNVVVLILQSDYLQEDTERLMALHSAGGQLYHGHPYLSPRWPRADACYLTEH